jgi:hypothetical protein
MPKKACRTLVIALLAIGLLFGLAVIPRLSEAPSNALAARPTPTYVSELAPAVSIAPREAASLPVTGGALDVRDALPVPKVAGIAIALAGLVMIHAGLRLGPRRTP